MMKTWIRATAFAAGLVGAAAAFAQAVVGQPAPAFSATDATGKAVSLADYKGKHVVLEWVNPSCPFVQKHYNSGNMPATQKAALAKGAVWLTIASTAKDHSEYRQPAELASWMRGKQAASTATVMDEDGRIGRAYGARVTPHMYIVDPQGKLLYAGAIDSKPSSNPADIATATNYITQGIGELSSGKPLSQATTRAYGCSIKYSSAG